ncbi:MAG: error-prone DNA polymerase [Candidatus Cloacimonetes bacterium]|nr:error-prone DNA polymerase [Candidatus Cloacimonadota bacterium]
MSFAELASKSWFSFLRGASSPEDLVDEAAELGICSLALTDRMGLYGIVPFLNQCQKRGIHGIVGAQLIFEDEDSILVLCENRIGYTNLCHLLTRAARQSPPKESRISVRLLQEHIEGLFVLLADRESHAWGYARNKKVLKLRDNLNFWVQLFGQKRSFILYTSHFEENENQANTLLSQFAEESGVLLIPSNQPLYATRGRAQVLEVLACIREHKTLEQSQDIRPLNQERCLKSQKELQKILPDYFVNAQNLASCCQVKLNFENVRIPDFKTPSQQSHDEYLRELCLQNLPRYYPDITGDVIQRLEEELLLICKKNLSGYFLVVWDLVSYAKEQGILCQGRGSAANSMVAYILGIMPVDPLKYNLLFGRFLNEETTSAPDIDLDFASTPGTQRPDRETVIQYVYQKYGADHVAMVSTFVTFQARMAIREVGKVFEMPEEVLDLMAKMCGGYSFRRSFDEIFSIKSLKEWYASPYWEPFLRILHEIQDVPRHLSIHVGGMLVTSRPLWEIVPLEPASMEKRVVCQWDKDMVEDAGLIKIDILGLRMLSVLGDVKRMVELESGEALDLLNISREDPFVYEQICEADTVGLFQVESRAQMQSLPRTRPKNFSELGIQVAIIRPGPLQGNMVNPYIERKQGREEVVYMHPLLEPVLSETLGVILFQEQVLKVAIVVANFSPGQAERLRKAMSRKRSRKEMQSLYDEFVKGATENGLDSETIERIFKTLEGFALYGFCKSHALAFANITYLSAWFRSYYPAHYVAALLNNQPMGFYSSDVLIQDAKGRGILFYPPSIQDSEVLTTVVSPMTNLGIRLGLTQVEGISTELASLIVKEKNMGPWKDLQNFLSRIPMHADKAEKLIRCGAMDFLGIPRRELLWELWAWHKRDKENPKNAAALRQKINTPVLKKQSDWEMMAEEYSVMGVGSRHHPMELLRKQLRVRVMDSRSLKTIPSGAMAQIAGMVITRQRPPTAKGFAFLTLEDEFGMINLVLSPLTYERFRAEFRTQKFLLARGYRQYKDGVENLKVSYLQAIH